MCPKRSSRRWTSSPRSTTPPAAIPRSGPSSTRCWPSSSAGPRRSPRRRASARRSAPRVVLKREDLNHTGAHKINNTIGQALLARRMGKRRIIAETGAGQHGVATATVCARFGLECVVYMGAEDVARQRSTCTACSCSAPPSCRWSRAPGRSRTRPTRRCATGSPTCPPPTTSSARWWAPTRIPRMVRDFQSVIGREARAQMLARYGRLPHTVVACVGGGSNAMGIFTGFLDDAEVRLVGVEAAGEGIAIGPPQRHAQRRHARRAARQPELPAAGRRRPGVAGALDLGGTRLSGRRAGAQLSPRHRPRQLRHRRPTRRRSTRSRRSAGSRASSRRSRPPTRSPGCGAWRGAGPPTRSCCVCLSGRGDKDVAHVAALLGSRRVTAARRPTGRPAGVPGRRADQQPGEGAPRLPHVPAQQSDLPARHPRTSGPRSSRSGRRSTSWSSTWRRPISSGRSRSSIISRTRAKAWPGGCSRTACARSPSAAGPRRRSCPASSTDQPGALSAGGCRRRPAHPALGTGIPVHPVPLHRVLRRGRRLAAGGVGPGDGGRQRARDRQGAARPGGGGSAAPAQGRGRSRGLRLHALLPRRGRDQRGRAPSWRRSIAATFGARRSTCCSTCSSSRATRHPGRDPRHPREPVPQLSQCARFPDRCRGAPRVPRWSRPRASGLTAAHRTAARGFVSQAERAGDREPADAVARRGAGACRPRRRCAEVLRELQAAALEPCSPGCPSCPPRRCATCWKAWSTGWPRRIRPRCCGFCGIPIRRRLPGVVALCGRLDAASGGSRPRRDGEACRSRPCRLAAVQALAQLGTPAALALIEQAIEDADRGVRLAAVRAAGARGYKGALRRVEGVVLGQGREGDGPHREDGVLRGLRRHRRRGRAQGAERRSCCRAGCSS